MMPKRSEPPKVVEIMEATLDKISYDVDLLEKFLHLVFGFEVSKDEKIACWATKTILGLPMPDSELLGKLDGETDQLSLYFGSSTIIEDEADKVAYNLPEYFERLSVVTIDVKHGMRVPKSFEPTYIIQIGPDKQYGYVLKEPIDVYKIAYAFTQVLAGSELFRQGLPSPLKVVRLPAGIRGGEGKRRLQLVELKKMDGPKWTPEKLLKILDLGIDWQKLSDSPLTTLKEIRIGRLGTAPFLERQPIITALNGEIDPVTEWLFKSFMVKQYLNDKLTIICPWDDLHKNQADHTCYYPIGHIIDKGVRKFSCQDPACMNRSTGDFLKSVYEMGGPSENAEDITPALVAKYAFDILENAVWDVKSETAPKIIKFPAFRNAYSKKIPIMTDGKKTRIGVVTHYNNSDYKITVEGRILEPNTTAKIVKSDYNDTLVNRFYIPDWGTGKYQTSHVEQFQEFIRYLVPDKTERNYFLNWLACKVQFMGFRGAAILMIAVKQGTGRNTLASMMSQLFGPANVEYVSFNRLIGEDKFNEWVEAPVIVTDETLSSTNIAKFRMAYERLKELIDPRPKPVRVDPKYGRQRISTIYSSFLFMSNHENAITMAENDRRFYVITNPKVEASPQYFGTLNRWMERKGDNNRPIWAKHIWRWLQEREVNIEEMLKPPITTKGKKRMLSSSRSKMELAIDGFLEFNAGIFITKEMVVKALEEMKVSILGHASNSSLHRDVNSLIRERTLDIGNGIPLRLFDHNSRVKLIMGRLSSDETEALVRRTMSPTLRKQIREDAILSMEKWDKTIESTRKYVNENYG
jgi:hypothetical protein